MADDMKKRIASELEYHIRTAAALGHSQGKRGTDISAELERQIEGAIAALGAVAADIWDEGYEAGRDEDDGGGRLHPNPYETGA